MHRFSITCFGLAALIAFACGAPAELDDGLFPDTYADDETGSTGNGGAPSLGGTGSIPPSGAGGAAPIGSGGSDLPSGVSGAPPISGSGGLASGGGGAEPSGGCPDDMTLIFNRPIEQGGCAGSACHIPGATKPDLVSPDPLSRLLNVQSSCNGLSYIGASPEQSLLTFKVTTPPADCGFPMPFLRQEALSEADEACILEWVAENAGG
ncbi:MAG TPA: hypothetical protein VNN80_00440 [Polyangiaceae bacterium]|nr:hypothetical protein [Polyangiaceae bacterium]